jgi:hypothetical protein
MSRSSNLQLLAVWHERLTRYAATDQTVAQFCRDEGVSTPSFYQWKKKLGEKNLARQAPPPFVPLTLSMPQQQATTLTLPGGASLDLPVELSRKRLTEVLAAVIEVTKNEVTKNWEADRC